MPEEIDIYRSANLLIKQHGPDAKVFAAMQADACAGEGDRQGHATWLRVIQAISELQNTTQAPPSRPH